MEKCKECRFCNCSPLPETYGRGSKNARIMFIQDFVTDSENNRGIQFWGKSCDELRKQMKELEIDIDDIYWTSVIKCPMPDEFYKPTIKDSRICVDSLLSEIEIIDPDIIVPTGPLSLKYTLNRIDITKIRGNAQEAEICGRKRIVIPIIHPRQSLKKPVYKDLTKKDIKTLADMIDNGMNEVTGVNYRSLETIDEVLEECERLSKADWISFDLETTGLSPFQDDSAIVCISLTDKPYYGVCIPLYHPETPFTTPELGTVVKALRKLLQNPSIKKVAQNGKFDIKWLHSWLGILVENFCFDTMLAHYIAVSEESGTQGLKSMAWEYTDMGGYDNELDEYKSTLSPAMRNNYGNIPWNILSRYAAADVDCCIRLKDIFLPMIEENPKWKVLFSDILMPASYALMTLEEDGMLMDDNLIDKYEKSYSDEISRIQSRLQSYPEVLQIERERREKYREREAIALIKKADRTAEEQRKFEAYKKYKDSSFSWSSPAQLKELLFDRLGLTTTVRTAKGELSTNEDALIEMSEQHELPALMMELRKVQTLYSMFIKKLPDMRDKTGRVHPVYNLSGCITKDSIILTDEGMKPIGDIVGEQQNGEFIHKEVNIVNRYGELESTSNIVRFENQPIVEVTTALGFKISGTYDHPIITSKYNKYQIQSNRSVKRKAMNNEDCKIWTNLSDVKTGKYSSVVPIPYGQNVFGRTIKQIVPWNFVIRTNAKNGLKIPTEINANIAELLGMYYADGCVKDGNGSWSIEICNKDVEVIEEVKRISLEEFGIDPTVYSDNYTQYTSICSINLKPIESQLELQRGCLNKTIPQFILDAPKNIVVSYLRGMTLDSSVSNDKGTIKFAYCFAREDVARTVQLMLLNLGIVSSYYQDRYSSNTYEVHINSEEYVKFIKTVGVIQSKKDLSNLVKTGLKSNYINDKENKCIWLYVKNIEYNHADVYDFTVPNSHSFIANGFISHNTVTGRLASQNPNAQQMPRKAEVPSLFQYQNEPKALFCSRFGDEGCIVNLDYSQLELRVAGIISQDSILEEVYKSGVDLHIATASKTFGVPIEEVTKDLRTKAKGVNN